MILAKTISIRANTLRELNAILATENVQPTAEDVMFSVTVEFDDGCQADIKLVNGEPPYVDPVLFDKEGNELGTIEPDSETFQGEYIWEVNGRQYVATIEEDAS